MPASRTARQSAPQPPPGTLAGVLAHPVTAGPVALLQPAVTPGITGLGQEAEGHRAGLL